jgi:hypothetical protein
MADADGSAPSSITRLAFHNLPNYAFLVGAAAFTVSFFATFSFWPLAVAAGAEAAWLLIGARVGGPRRYFEFLRREQRDRLSDGGRRKMLRAINEADRGRYGELERMRKDIHEQVARNPSLAMDLVKDELEKIDRLIETFLLLSATCARWEQYVETSDLNQIEAEVRRQESILERAEGDTRALAQQNLEILKRRLDKAVEVRRQLRHARGQLNLIDNTFRLLRDQIVTMESVQELSGQLAQLTASVDAIAAADKETEALVRRLDRQIETLRQ